MARFEPGYGAPLKPLAQPGQRVYVYRVSPGLAAMHYDWSILSLRTATVLVLLLVLSGGATLVTAQTATPALPIVYQLVADASLLDDCPVCGRPSILVPMRGSFTLRLLDESLPATHYALENVHFTAGDRPYLVTGGGVLTLLGDFTVTLQLSLAVQINDGYTNRTCYFTNESTFLNRRWPMLDVTLTQTNGTFTQVYNLRLAAAPLREIWFSTATSFTASTGDPAAKFTRGGDLLSTTGRQVKRNADLFTTVGAFPPGPDLGLDAIDVLPGAEIAFSLGSGITSDWLGQLQHGDLLSTRGIILHRNQELLAAFAPAKTNDFGLDAAHVLPTGEVLFSLPTNVFSQRLNTTLQRGDLLSNQGTVFRSNQQLLAAFHPPKPGGDYGLDAFYLWPNGEIWFSTEDAFQDQVLGPIAGGDLLSDQGYVVYRNADLLAAFAPTNAPADLGLDALFVVTDEVPLLPSPVLGLAFDSPKAGAQLTWSGRGGVFQLERSDRLEGPYQPFTPILPELSFTDPGALTNQGRMFYRVRQW